MIVEYFNNTYGFGKLCRLYGMSQSALKDWIRLYNTLGHEGLRTGSKASHYWVETKLAAINVYLSGQLTYGR
ncbi:MAG: helix-turn-helix domain-containing protein [Lachnospiraceae bacterium]|nr:helix-turn-helix domain-containing protein [Lachnospiraceae bacterium]